MTKSNAQRNLKLLYALSFLHGFRTYEGVLAVYIAALTDSFTIGMTFFALVNLTSSFFEVPTGVVSDRIGRRKTIIMFYVTSTLSILVIFLAEEAWHIYLAASLAGLSMALRSGTVTAFVYENLELLNELHLYKLYEGRRRALNRYALTAASVVGAALMYFYSVEAALFVSVLVLLCMSLISFFLKDVRTYGVNGNSIYEDLGLAWQQFLQKPILRNLSLARLLATALGNVEYRFRSLFFASLMPIWLVNIIGGLNNLMTGVASQYAHAIVTRFGYMRSLVHIDLFDRVLVVVLIITKSIPGSIAMNVLTAVTHGIREVAAEELLQQRYSKEQRATMGSIVGLGGNILYGIFGISVGLLADEIGVFWTMLFIQPLLFLPAIFFYRGIKLSNQ